MQNIHRATLDNYKEIVGEEIVNNLRAIGERLSDLRILHINSTAAGGGVAEILQRLVPLTNDAGIKADWHVMKAEEEFFKITKSFHNALHGVPIQLSQDMFDSYLSTAEANQDILEGDYDFVFVHDPQPTALIKYRKGGKWIWRCHIDVSEPNPELWSFLDSHIKKYDSTMYSMDTFEKKTAIRQFIVPPAIDPLSDKNKELKDHEISTVLEKYDIDPDKPIIAQISRYDKLKDPEGVIDAYIATKDHYDCQLVLSGSAAVDDPEASEVLRNTEIKAQDHRNIHVLKNLTDIEVNALQRASAVILQKSLKEGFALTVSESLWKGTPVIGGNTGGIPLQVINGQNGFLVNSVADAVNALIQIFRKTKIAKEMGMNGKEHVRRNFLMTRLLRDHLFILLTLMHVPGKLKQL
ncbi:MAG: glycosyltransferase [Candidatus Bathyarchaeota archaeon]